MPDIKTLAAARNVDLVNTFTNVVFYDSVKCHGFRTAVLIHILHFRHTSMTRLLA